MTNPTGLFAKFDKSAAKVVARAISCSLLTSLPLCGLVLFFELTRPASAPGEGLLSKHLSDTVWRTAFGSQRAYPFSSSMPGSPVARFEGVSAELRDSGKAKIQSAKLTELANRAFSDASSTPLRVGLRAEFAAADGHRLVFRIIRRDPVTDEPVPDNSRMMNIAPASTAHVVSFIWGQWRYSVEIQDHGRDPEIAVQKSL